MPRYAYDRLTALDNSFLVLERPNAYMHVASTMVFEAGPLRKPDGGVDADAIRERVGASLHRIPRYRQKLAWIPFESHAVWVDDDRFQLDYHDKFPIFLQFFELHHHGPEWHHHHLCRGSAIYGKCIRHSRYAIPDNCCDL